MTPSISTKVLPAVIISALLFVDQECAQAESPTTGPAGRTEAELLSAIQSGGAKVNALIGDDAVLADPQKRQAVATEATAALKQFRTDLDELGVRRPDMLRRVNPVLFQVTRSLSVLGDADATARIAAMTSSVDSAQALAGKGAQLLVRWFHTDKDGSAQTTIADEIEKLDQAHIDNPTLTVITAQMSKTASTPELSDRLMKIVTNVMKNPAVQQLKMQEEARLAADKLKQMENKPFVMTAKTVDGADFTTATFAGKVVLVDFWATWCGPCKAELPNVQKLYAKEHPNGLEVVGVSNDFSADALRQYVSTAPMPWPQLFDQQAAAQQQWNPTTLNYGITAIPHMFVIDKKGVLRSSDARASYQELVTKLLSE